METIKTNDLKKGAVVQLSNGWFAVIADNKKGDIRLAKVHGICTELGSVYSHNIIFYFPEVKENEIREKCLFSSIAPRYIKIEHTPKQLKLKQQVESL